MDVRTSATDIMTAPALHTSSNSVNETHASNDYGARVNESEPAAPAPEPKKKFRFPRLRLVDKKKPDTALRSCIESTSTVPANDAKIHEEELNCCPPCDPPKLSSLRYLVKQPSSPNAVLQVQPSDLSCFLAGCKPGTANCELHRSRNNSGTHYSSVVERKNDSDYRELAEKLAKDADRRSITWKGVKIQTPNTVSVDDTAEDSEVRDLRDLKQGTQRPRAITLMSPMDVKYPGSRSMSTVTSGSVDIFPHATHSLEAAAKVGLLSTSIATNFSLSGYKETTRIPRRNSSSLSRGGAARELARSRATTRSGPLESVSEAPSNEVVLSTESDAWPEPRLVSVDATGYIRSSIVSSDSKQAALQDVIRPQPPTSLSSNQVLMIEVEGAVRTRASTGASRSKYTPQIQAAITEEASPPPSRLRSPVVDAKSSDLSLSTNSYTPSIYSTDSFGQPAAPRISPIVTIPEVLSPGPPSVGFLGSIIAGTSTEYDNAKTDLVRQSADSAEEAVAVSDIDEDNIDAKLVRALVDEGIVDASNIDVPEDTGVLALESVINPTIMPDDGFLRLLKSEGNTDVPKDESQVEIVRMTVGREAADEEVQVENVRMSVGSSQTSESLPGDSCTSILQSRSNTPQVLNSQPVRVSIPGTVQQSVTSRAGSCDSARHLGGSAPTTPGAQLMHWSVPGSIVQSESVPEGSVDLDVVLRSRSSTVAIWNAQLGRMSMPGSTAQPGYGPGGSFESEAMSQLSSDKLGDTPQIPTRVSSAPKAHLVRMPMSGPADQGEIFEEPRDSSLEPFSVCIPRILYPQFIPGTEYSKPKRSPIPVRPSDTTTPITNVEKRERYSETSKVKSCTTVVESKQRRRSISEAPERVANETTIDINARSETFPLANRPTPDAHFPHTVIDRTTASTTKDAAQVYSDAASSPPTESLGTSTSRKALTARGSPTPRAGAQETPRDTYDPARKPRAASMTMITESSTPVPQLSRILVESREKAAASDVLDEPYVFPRGGTRISRASTIPGTATHASPQLGPQAQETASVRDATLCTGITGVGEFAEHDAPSTLIEQLSLDKKDLVAKPATTNAAKSRASSVWKMVAIKEHELQTEANQEKGPNPVFEQETSAAATRRSFSASGEMVEIDGAVSSAMCNTTKITADVVSEDSNLLTKRNEDSEQGDGSTSVALLPSPKNSGATKALDSYPTSQGNSFAITAEKLDSGLPPSLKERLDSTKEIQSRIHAQRNSVALSKETLDSPVSTVLMEQLNIAQEVESESATIQQKSLVIEEEKVDPSAFPTFIEQPSPTQNYAFQGIAAHPKSPVAVEEKVEPTPASAPVRVVNIAEAFLSSITPDQERSVEPAHCDKSVVTYWGFGPEIQNTFQDVVKTAVRNAVQDIGVHLRTQVNEDSDHCRRLHVDSLNEDARDPDNSPQEPSISNQSPSSRDVSEATVLGHGRALVDELPSAEQITSQGKSRTTSILPETVMIPVIEPVTQVSSRTSSLSKIKTERALKHQASQTVTLTGTQENDLSNMEVIPLDPTSDQLIGKEKQGWGLLGVLNKRSTFAAKYTEIPSRSSSRSQILGTDSNATKFSSPSMLSRQSLSTGIGTRGLRTISSAGSLHVSSRHVTLVAKKKSESHSPALKAVAEKLLQKSKDLLADSGITKPDATKAKMEKIPDAAHSLTQTISHLESLMNEALVIARAAAERHDAHDILGTTTKVPKERHEDIGGNAAEREALLTQRTQARVIDQTSNRNDESDTASIHESLRSISDSSAYDTIDEGESLPRIVTPAVLSHTVTLATNELSNKSLAGWPPNGGAPTPYPPTSLHLSGSSYSSAGIDFVTRKSISQIGGADPHSMPLETDAGLAREKTVSIQAPLDYRSVGVFARASSRNPTIALSGTAELSENSQNTFLTSKPSEFRILEICSESQTADISRKGSARSPARLSPTRRSEAGVVSPSDKDNYSASVILDLCGQSKSVGCVKPLPEVAPCHLCKRLYDASSRCKAVHSKEEHQAVDDHLASNSVPGKGEIRDCILENQKPPIPNRKSSLHMRKQAAEQAQDDSNLSSERSYQISKKMGNNGKIGHTFNFQSIDQSKIDPCSQLGTERVPTPHFAFQHQIIQPVYAHSFDGTEGTHSVMDFETGFVVRKRTGEVQSSPVRPSPQPPIELQDLPPNPSLPQTNPPKPKRHVFSLQGERHLSLREHHLKGFSLARSKKKQKIARDWSSGRKRFVASCACISTALVGILVGVYAGETPAIQYKIVDFHHYTVLGNVFFFIGLSIPTFLFWPLPLLHGRKPYIMGAMSLAMPLLFPQALAVGEFRSPYTATWRVALLLPRALMGFCLGFANMNFKGTLTDLFGASLQSTNPHQEHVDEFDVRRHGGGMGIWLGLWTWSALGSIGFGFMIGAVIINKYEPAWGFYISIAIIAFVMFLNVLCPEVRRSAYRRSVVEVVTGESVSRRLAKGEVKMHMVQTGPRWWGEEFHYGVQLSKHMLRQPGFMVMSLYVAWIYGQQVLIIVLLGALMSKDYKFKSPEVGASVMAIPLGALVAIPFQKASIFSRSRQNSSISNNKTLSKEKKKVSWTSHMVRRSIFVLVLPFMGLAYTLSSGGPPTPFILPILFAGAIGFLSNLAMAECHGIIMELFDTSDLQPGMTGRPKGAASDRSASKRTNYSSFPRVMSAFALTQGMGYLVAAAATGVAGVLTRHLGTQAATGTMAGILLILSVMLLGVLIRFKEVQIIPDARKQEMLEYQQARRASAVRREEGVEEEEPWRPIIIGNPLHITRRMSLLELGGMTRFSDIRKKNKLVDEKSLEAKHPNRAAIAELEQKLKDKEVEIVHHVRRSLSRHSSKDSRYRVQSEGPEQGDLGGHREMLRRNPSSQPNEGSRRGRGTSTARRKISE